MAKDKCDRNCSTCTIDNRTFCAVQMAMANQEMIMAIQKRMDEMNERQMKKEELLHPAYNDIPAPTDPGTVEPIIQ